MCIVVMCFVFSALESTVSFPKGTINCIVFVLICNISVAVFLPELSGTEAILELGLAERGEERGISAVAFTM